MSRHEKIGMLASLLSAAFLLFLGWKLFWFLTDDAFIAFRYISNSQKGFGYVWNAPPFLPVEGYSSFLWVVLLDVCWRLFDVAPPESANWISLCCSFLTLCVGAAIMLRLRWSDTLKPFRVPFVLLFFLFTLTNRTFLAWSSSGLETALFCFLITAWCYAWVFLRPVFVRTFMGCLVAALLALTRPEGLLYCLASLVMAMVVFRGALLSQVKSLVALSPFLLVFAHLLWRHHFYGEWLPNTYYAKVIEAQPLSGLIYAAAFVLEYGLWFLLVPIPFVVLFIRRNKEAILFSDWIQKENLLLLCAIGTVLAHTAYYTLIVGGDHFEFRVYCQLIPFLFIAFVWMLNRCAMKPVLGLSLTLLFVGYSLPFQWIHWAVSDREKQAEVLLPVAVPIASEVSPIFRFGARLYDQTQAWLIPRLVGVRWHDHRAICLRHQSLCPTRAEGAQIPAEDFPVLAADGIGFEAWSLPTVNIIDLLGLNDYVIARFPVPPGRAKRMAHDRVAPVEYVRAFRPNVTVGDNGAKVYPRVKPLTAQEIQEIEAVWRNGFEQ